MGREIYVWYTVRTFNYNRLGVVIHREVGRYIHGILHYASFAVANEDSVQNDILHPPSRTSFGMTLISDQSINPTNPSSDNYAATAIGLSARSLFRRTLTILEMPSSSCVTP